MTWPAPNAKPNAAGTAAALLGPPVWIAMLALLFLGPLLALFLPDRPYDSWPWTRAFSDFVAGYVPSVEYLSRITTWPQAARLYLSLSWVVWFPAFTALLLSLRWPTEASVVRAMHFSQSRWWHFVLLPFVMLMMLWAVWGGVHSFENSAPLSQLVRAMSRYRYWFGLLGSTVAMMAAFAAAGLLRSVPTIRLAYRLRKHSPVHGGF